jgi:hypothetical protein
MPEPSLLFVVLLLPPLSRSPAGTMKHTFENSSNTLATNLSKRKVLLFVW